jgi:hypothetical protein
VSNVKGTTKSRVLEERVLRKEFGSKSVEGEEKEAEEGFTIRRVMVFDPHQIILGKSGVEN